MSGDEHLSRRPSYRVGMSTLREVEAWVNEQLPALIEKYDVPGAAVGGPRRR